MNRTSDLSLSFLFPFGMGRNVPGRRWAFASSFLVHTLKRMQALKTFLFGIFFWVALCTGQQSFAACVNGQMFLSQNPDIDTMTHLSSISLATNPVSFPAVGPTSSVQYNAMGYDPNADIIYAIGWGTNVLYSVNPTTGAVTSLGSLTGTLPAQNVNGGAMDDTSHLLSHLFVTSTSFFYTDVTTRATIGLTGSQAVNVADFAWNKNDGLFYGIDSVTESLVSLKVNVAAGTVTVTNIGSTLLNAGASMGAFYVDALGHMFAVGSVTGNKGPQNLYQFDPLTGRATLIGSAPISNFNDGASCPLVTLNFNTDLQIVKTQSSTTYTPGKPMTYTIVAKNNGPFGTAAATVSDLVPAGIPAANVSYTAVASNGATTKVVGTQTGAIADTVDLPYDVGPEAAPYATPIAGYVTYTVTVNVPSGFTGNLVNTGNVAIKPNSGVIDSNSGNNSSTVTATPAPSADLAVTKTNNVSVLLPNANTTYIVTVTNKGPSDSVAILKDPGCHGIK